MDLQMDHLRSLSIAFFKHLTFDDTVNNGAPMLDPKRPFGNEHYQADILEIIGLTPQGDEGEYTDEQYDYAEKLYQEHLVDYLKTWGKKLFREIS